MTSLEKRVAALEELVATLLVKNERTNECIKGQDPETCSKASPHYYQQKCGGAACRRVNKAYYSPDAKAARRAAAATPVKPPTRKKVWGAPRTEG